jgi:hypothetical protein
MRSTITVNLIPDCDVEAFNDEERHLARVCVSIDGISSDPSKTIVSLILSQEAMIGLATELFRAAYRTSSASSYAELMPSKAGFIRENYGIILHPKSCRLNLREDNMGSISEAIKEAQIDAPSDGG